MIAVYKYLLVAGRLDSIGLLGLTDKHYGSVTGSWSGQTSNDKQGADF